MPLSMDNRNRMVCLFDCYGRLLTEKQRTLFAYYFDEDLSLAEISDLVGISRQAVHNSISRCEESLEAFEKNLGMLRRDGEVDAGARSHHRRHRDRAQHRPVAGGNVYRDTGTTKKDQKG